MTEQASIVSMLIFLILIMCIISTIEVRADVIMMNMNGGLPSIIDDDEYPDIILMPGMGNMMINDDLVL